MANEVKFEVTLEEKQAIDAIKKIAGNIEEFGKLAEKNFNNASQSFNAFTGSLAATAVTKGLGLLKDAALGLFHAVATEGVNAAIAEEQALTRLNTALELSGNASATATNDLKSYAGQMELLTGIQDDVVLNNLALLQSFGPLTTEGLKAASSAAADLATKFGVDLETATRAIGAAAQGNIGLLQRITKQTFEKGATDADTFILALEKVNSISLGAAEKQMMTFEGALKGAQNSFGNFTEEIGRLITNNEAVKSGLRLIADVFRELEEFVNKNKDAISEYITGGVNILIDGFKSIVSFVKNFIGSINETGSILNLTKENFLRVVEVIKFLISGFSDSSSAIGLFIGFIKAVITTLYTFQSIILDIVGLAFKLLASGLEKIGISVDDLIVGFKKFASFMVNNFVSALEAALFTLGKVVGLLDAELGNKITNAINPLKSFSKTLNESASGQINDSKAIVEAKKEEVDAHVSGENKKTEATTKGALIRKEKVLQDINFVLELERAKQEDLKKIQAAEMLFRQQGEKEIFDILVSGLGRREAARVANEVLRLEKEKKFSEARLLLLTSEEKARDEIAKRQIEDEKKRKEELDEFNRRRALDDLNFAQLNEQGRRDIEQENADLKAVFQTEQEQKLLQILVDGLGQRQAAELAFEVSSLQRQGKFAEARRRIAESEVTAQKAIDEKKKAADKEREANIKGSLGIISGLHSESNRELFYIGKAAALAQAYLDAEVAISKAWAVGGPFGAVLAAAVTIATAANIARIARAEPPSRQGGGILPGVASPTDTTLFNGAPGELILNRRQQTNLFNAINQNQLSGSSGTVINIQGNVIADDDSQVQNLIMRIKDQVEFRNAVLA